MKRKGLLTKILSEPLFHFILWGAVVFYVSEFIAGQIEQEKTLIEVERGDIELLYQRWIKQLNRPPTDDETKLFIDNYIKEEVLYREAQRLGFDQDDQFIKRRAIQKFEFFADDILRPSVVSQSALNNYFNENIDKYTIPEKIDFIQIYFTLEGKEEESLMSRITKVKNKLNNTDAIPTNFYLHGDASILPNSFKKQTIDAIANKFGRYEMTANLFSIKENSWEGPFLSSYGLHLVYITKKHPEEVPKFESIRERVEIDFRIKLKDEAYANFLEELKNKYSIVYTKDLSRYIDSLKQLSIDN